MQKNWYILYTKSGYERKVSSLLTKKNIENFYAINTKRVEYQKKIKTITEPLFPSFIFVYTSCQQIERLKNVDHVLNLVHWKDKPATLAHEEIEVIKEFTETYQNINIEKIKVNHQRFNQDSYNELQAAFDGKMLILKNRILKVNLSSLGYAISVSVERPGIIFGKELTKSVKKVSLQ